MLQMCLNGTYNSKFYVTVILVKRQLSKMLPQGLVWSDCNIEIQRWHDVVAMLVQHCGNVD